MRYRVYQKGKYFAINDDVSEYSVISCIRTEIEAKWLCDLLNEKERLISKCDCDKINKCENCYHFNPLVHWGEGYFYQCMLGNKLWEKCNDFESVD